MKELKNLISYILVLLGIFFVLYGAAWGFQAETVEDVGFAVAVIGIGLALLILWTCAILQKRIARLYSTLKLQGNCCGAVEFILSPISYTEKAEDFCQSEEEG